MSYLVVFTRNDCPSIKIKSIIYETFSNVHNSTTNHFSRCRKPYDRVIIRNKMLLKADCGCKVEIYRINEVPQSMIDAFQETFKELEGQPED